MEEKLSICLINDSFPPLIDGVAKTVENYASIINEKYGKACVAVPFYPNTDDGGYPYKVIRFPSINTEKLVNYRAGYPFSPETLEEIKKENINIIHTHCPFSSVLLARTLRKPLDAPVIFTYHTKFDVDVARSVGNNYLKEKVLKFISKNIEACDEVWVVSEGAGKNLKSIGYTGDYIVMPNGVDFPKGRVSDDEIKKVTEKYNLPEGVPVFLFVGRTAWYKGIDIILDALSALKKAEKDFRMVFIGGGMDEKEIKEYSERLELSEKCIFTGAVHERDVLRAWYCRADVLLFPSVYDTNGLVVREAAACGLASVLVKESCAAEGITDGETGFLIENNAKSLFEKLTMLCDNPKLFEKAGKNAMDKIYISRGEAVDMAVKRYETVLENYRAGKYKKEETNFSDEWFRAEGEILDAISKIKNRKYLFVK